MDARNWIVSGSAASWQTSLQRKNVDYEGRYNIQILCDDKLYESNTRWNQILSDIGTNHQFIWVEVAQNSEIGSLKNRIKPSLFSLTVVVFP
jgi:hypothetical protein